MAPGKDGLVKIKDLEFKRTEKVEDVLNIGDMTWVKVMNVGRPRPRGPEPQGRHAREGTHVKRKKRACLIGRLSF